MRSTTLSGVSTTYTYDANGNTTGSAQGKSNVRTFTYNYDNQPSAMVFTGASTANESYTYDADGERVVRSVATGVTTYYIGGGIYEEDMPNGVTRSMYSLNGQVVAQRMVNPSLFAPIITYLHSDQLGSVSVATDPSGNPVSSQEYDPWGAVISGGVSQTAINYTGQRLDATGLLYYHARYYDPALGKFLTPDSIVPGASIGAGGALGTVGQEQNSRLTVDFHESGFLSSANGETRLILSKGFWFQLSGQDRQSSASHWGPGNPQALNRYAYTLSNPLKYVDPTGHIIYLNHQQAAELVKALRQVVSELTAIADGVDTALEGHDTLMDLLKEHPVLQAIGLAAFLAGSWQTLQLTGPGGIVNSLDGLANAIECLNQDYGVAIYYDMSGGPAFTSDTWVVMDRYNGEVIRTPGSRWLRGWVRHYWVSSPVQDDWGAATGAPYWLDASGHSRKRCDWFYKDHLGNPNYNHPLPGC